MRYVLWLWALAAASAAYTAWGPIWQPSELHAPVMLFVTGWSVGIAYCVTLDHMRTRRLRM